MRIALKDLKPNPFRHLDHYPIRRDKVDALKASISSTEFWDNLLARKNGSGYEIAYGHHRLHALRELKVKEIDIQVRNLDDATMLKIMAHENMEEWGASAAIEQETVRATVQAFADGRISLPKPKFNTERHGGRGAALKIREAPGFQALPISGLQEIGKAYTAKCLADFLGWRPWRVENALAAIELQYGVGSSIDFVGLTSDQAAKVVLETHHVSKRTGDKKLAAKIGGQLAEEFKEMAGRSPRGKPGKFNTKTVRDRTEDLLLEHGARSELRQEKKATDKREVEAKDRQVKEFFEACKAWKRAVAEAQKARSKFSPEARKFAIRRIDECLTLGCKLQEYLK